MSHFQKQVDKWVNEHRKEDVSITELLQKTSPQANVEESINQAKEKAITKKNVS